MADSMCSCGHDRRQHGKDGCMEWKGNKPCTCKKTYMDMRGRR